MIGQQTKGLYNKRKPFAFSNQTLPLYLNPNHDLSSKPNNLLSQVEGGVRPSMVRSEDCRAALEQKTDH